jgi:tetratricopeptide (TPR) repeat protein
MRILKYIIFSFFYFLTLILFAQNSTDEELAGQYYHNKEFEKALVYYESFYNKSPDLKNYKAYLDCLLSLQYYDKAEKIIRKQLKQNPQKLSYNVDLGFILNYTKDKEKSQKEYEKILKNLPPNQDIITDVANAFLNRKEISLAIETYKKGRNLLKGTYGFHYELAELYDKISEYENMYEEYLQLYDENSINQTSLQNTLQTSFDNDIEGHKSKILEKILMQRIQKYPDVLYYSEMLIWLAIQKKDFEMAYIQNKAIDRRRNEDGYRLYDLAKICMSNGSYDIAIECYKYIIDKGPKNNNYNNAKIELLTALYNKISAQVIISEPEIMDLNNKYINTINELGKTSTTATLLKEYAHFLALFLKEYDKATDFLYDIIEMPQVSLRVQSEAKLELGDIMLMKGEIWEATLLYSQVEKAMKEDPIGHLAKLKNAKLSYYIGDFGWAQQQLNVLKAATSKLIANDAMDLSMFISDNIDADSSTAALALYSKADFLSFQNKDDEAIETLDSIKLLYNNQFYSLLDDVWMKKAKIYIKKGKIELADSLLSNIVSERGDDLLADDALFMRAELYNNYFKDKTKAMNFYQDLITKYPGSFYVVEARKIYRKLRGDNVN